MEKSKQQLIHEALLNDKHLIELNKKRAELYHYSTPTLVMKNNEIIGTIDSVEHSFILQKIEQQIELRTNQIKTFYK